MPLVFLFKKEHVAIIFHQVRLRNLVLVPYCSCHLLLIPQVINDNKLVILMIKNIVALAFTLVFDCHLLQNIQCAVVSFRKEVPTHIVYVIHFDSDSIEAYSRMSFNEHYM